MTQADAPVFLYVEDDMFSRKVIDVTMRRRMHLEKITFFSDSADFETRVNALEETPGIIFLDIQIGPLDGYDMLKLLRASERFKGAKVIAMTANVMAHDVDSLRRAGFDGLIGKPIIQEVFPELLNRILHGESIWYVP